MLMLTVNITINNCVLDSNYRVLVALDLLETSTEFLCIISIEVILQTIKLTRHVSSGDITAITLKIIVLWDLTPSCILATL